MSRKPKGRTLPAANTNKEVDFVIATPDEDMDERRKAQRAGRLSRKGCSIMSASGAIAQTQALAAAAVTATSVAAIPSIRHDDSVTTLGLAPPPPSIPSSSLALSVSPRSVHLLGCQTGMAAHATLTIQNRSDRKRKVKWFQPATHSWHIETIGAASKINEIEGGIELSPGLSVKLRVVFVAPPPPSREAGQSDQEYEEITRRHHHQDWHDAFDIVWGEHGELERLSVALRASSRSSHIQVDRQLMDFGTITAQSTASSAAAESDATGNAGATSSLQQVLVLRNDGKGSGSFRFEFDASIPLTMTPNEGHIDAGQEVSIRATLNPHQLSTGPYRALGRLYLDEGPQPLLMDVAANVVEGSLQLIWPTLPIEEGKGKASTTAMDATSLLENLSRFQLDRVREVYFGSVYFGETRSIQAQLVNHSPNATNFLVSIADARDEKLGGGSGGALTGRGLDTSRSELAGGSSTSGSSSFTSRFKNVLAQRGVRPGGADSRFIPGSVLGETDLEGGAGSGTQRDGGDSSSSSGVHGNGNGGLYRPDILVSPMEGRLQPYGHLTLTFTFQPHQPRHLAREMSQGFKSSPYGGGAGSAEKLEPPFVSYQAVAKIDSLDGRFHVGVPVLGHANQPCVQLSSDRFDFGSCPMHESRDDFLSLTNLSSELPVAFQFDSIAGFHASPKFGVLAAKESRRIRMSFHPNNLGRFREKIMKLRLLGSPEGKKPQGLVPKVHASKASIKAAQQPKNEAEVVYTLTLSGLAETIGKNSTISSKTGGPQLMYEQAMSKKNELNLVPSLEEIQEEKERTLLAHGEAEISEDIEGKLVIRPRSHAATNKTSSSSFVQDGTKRKFHRISGWDNKDLTAKYQGRYEVKAGSMEAEDTFTPEELEARKMNHAYYKHYLKASRKARQDQCLAAQMEFETDIDPDRLTDLKGMGLSFADGLREPEPDLPEPSEKLKLKYPMAGFEGEGRKPPAAAASASSMKKRTKAFKTAPSTQAEKRDCETFLSSEELQQVVRTPKIMDFGTVAVGGVITKSFQVSNELEQHILIQVKIKSEELARTTPTSQLIPPGEVATFHVVFCSQREQEFKEALMYTINGLHDFNLVATASVVPVDLDLNKMEMKFQFDRVDQASTSSRAGSSPGMSGMSSSGMLGDLPSLPATQRDGGVGVGVGGASSSVAPFYVTEYLKLSNPFNVPTEFNFATPSHLDCFDVHPRQGAVPSEGSIKVAVRYEPRHAMAPFSAELICNILGGASKKIALRAACPESAVRFMSRGGAGTGTMKTVDFGVLCVGTPSTKTITLRNEGQTRTVFRCEDVPNCVRIRPNAGRIDAGCTMPLSITVYPTADMNLKHTIIVHIRGRPKDSKPLKLLLKGSSELPQLAVMESEINFGGVTLGSSTSRTVTLQNLSSTVPATVFLDMSHKSSEFSVSYMEGLGGDGDGGDDAAAAGRIRHSASSSSGTRHHAHHPSAIIQKVSSAFIRRCTSYAALEAAKESGTNLMQMDPSYLLPPGISADDANMVEETGYSFYLAPNAIVPFTLTFSPQRVIEHHFDLPLVVFGLPSYVGLHRLVNGVGLKSKLSLSSQSVDFGKKVILKRGLRTTKNPYVQSLTIRNEDTNEPIVWKMALETQQPNTPMSAFGSTPSTAGGRSTLGSGGSGGGGGGVSGAVSPAGSDFGAGFGGDLAWRLEPSTGRLDPGEECAISVFFTPTFAQSYNSTVEVFLEDLQGKPIEPNQSSSAQVMTLESGHSSAAPTGRGTSVAGRASSAGTASSSRPVLLPPMSSPLPACYTSLNLTGSGTPPRILFDRDEVVLPVVPLGITSKTTFYVVNEGYENLELRWEQGMDMTSGGAQSKNPQLNIHMPEGSTLGVKNRRLPVELTFTSKRPTSFTMMIHFFDSENTRFSIAVTATADNSVLTTQTYLETHVDEYEIGLAAPSPSTGAATSRARTAASSSSSSAYNKVLQLVELGADALGKSKKQGNGFVKLSTTATPSRPRRRVQSAARSMRKSFDFDQEAGAEDEEAQELLLKEQEEESKESYANADDIRRITREIRDIDLFTPGSATMHQNEDHDGVAHASNGERLTPIHMLAQSSQTGGGDGLYTHSLEAVIAYLQASNLLADGNPDHDDDSHDLSARSLIGTNTTSGVTSPAHPSSRLQSPLSRGSTGQMLAGASADTRLGTASTISGGAPVGSGSGVGGGHHGHGSSNAQDGSLTISITTFPHDLIQAHGRQVRHLTKSLTGKVVPTAASKKKASYGSFGRDRNSNTISLQPIHHTSNSATTGASFLNTKTKDTGLSKADTFILNVLEDHEELLIFLKSHGCLLGNIRPWHLMSWQHLQRMMLSQRTELNGEFFGSNSSNTNSNSAAAASSSNMSLSPSEVAARVRKMEKEFPPLSRQAWLTILVQIIKVFVLSRVTVSAFKQLPGMSADLPCMRYTYASSNVYSIGESILLEWLSFHYNRTHPLQPRNVVDFQSSLCDGLVIAGVMSSHMPTLASISNMRTHIASTEDCQYNANKILAALKELGLNYSITSTQLVNAHQRDMVLFILYLFQQLPHFVPKTVVEFNQKLGERATKCIELSNPSSTKHIVYSVALEGSPDFEIEKTTVRLAPRGKAGSRCKFPVHFFARFSRTVEARLVFRASNDSAAAGGHSTTGSAASTLVFLLQSQIHSRVPVKSYHAKSRMYETAIVDVRVTNSFDSDCTFQVMVKLEQEPSAAQSKNAANGAGGGAGNTNMMPPLRRVGSMTSSYDDGMSGRLSTARSPMSPGGAGDRLPPPIFCPYERIKLKAGETQSLPIHFLPLRMGTYRAHLLFLDELVGEFVIEVVGQSLAPAPLELFKWHVPLSQARNEHKELQLSFKNAGIDAARSQTYDRIRGLTRQQRDLKKMKADWNSQVLKNDLLPSNTAVTYNVVSNATFFQLSTNNVVLHDIKLEKDSMSKHYHHLHRAGVNSGTGAGSSSQAKSRPGGAGGAPMLITDITHAASINTARSDQGAAGSGVGSPSGAVSPTSATAAYMQGRASHQPDNKLSVLFTPKGPGIYRGELLLTSLFDARVYQLEAHVLPDETPTHIQFDVAARKTVTQEIPVTNPTNEPMQLKATLSARYFSAPSELSVPPHSVSNFPITFAPSWVCDVQGQLILANTRAGEQQDKQTFELRGVASEPLAEKHVVIESTARGTTEHQIALTNSGNADTLYQVECDLPTFNGAPTVRIPAHATLDYTFTLSPVTSGTTLGSLTLIQQANKQFQWYSIEVRVAPPKAEQEIRVECEVRKQAEVSVELKNPLDASVMLEATTEGAGLHGPRSIILEPHSTTKYEFVYAPLQPIQDGFGALTFSSVELGEIWYRLSLHATKSKETRLDFGEVQVGSSKTIEISIENPIDQILQLKSSLANSRNYSVKPSVLLIQPRASQTVSIRYTPSTIDEKQNGVVAFTHPQLGDWVFPCSGVGSRPESMPTTTIVTAVGSKASRTLTFKNPFGQKLKIDVSLHDKHAPSSPDQQRSYTSPWQLFMRKTSGLMVGPYGVIQLPFLFCPAIMSSHEAEVLVSTSSIGEEELLTFTFPLLGMAEGQTSAQSIELEGQARQRETKTVELKLEGLSLNDAAAADDKETQQQRQQQQISTKEFSIEIEASPEAQMKLSKSLAVAVTASNVTATTASVRVQLDLCPLLPMDVSGYLIVLRRSDKSGSQSHGRWRFPLHVVVSPPLPDDTLRLEASVGSTANLAFRLKNYKESDSPFIARLSVESATEFTVYPPHGVLSTEVDRREGGSQIIVSFSPTEYGKALRGTLHIETAEMFYAYALIGTHPRYTAPVVESSLDLRAENLRPHVPGQLSSSSKPVNHVQRNMVAAREAPKMKDKVEAARAWRGVGNTNSAAIAASILDTFPALPPINKK